VARRAAYIRSVLENNSNVVVVDAGNAFDKPGLQGQLKAEVAVSAMQLMAYDLLNLSSRELNYGTGFLSGEEFLCNLDETFNLPTVSANIVYQDTGEPVTESHYFIEFDSFKVGLTGIVAKEFDETILNSNQINPRGVTVLDEGVSLRAEVSKIRDEVDILIVLASVGMDRCKTLVQEVDGIDVMVCGQGDTSIPEPLMINGAYVVQAGFEGQHIGSLALSLDKDNLIRSAEGIIVELGASFDEGQEDIQVVLSNYYACLEDFKDILLDIEQSDPPEGGSYTGYALCKQCHPEQTDQWLDTFHAQAFESLRERCQDYNPECIPCHTTGFGYRGGFIMPELTSEMEGVQCEMCHGAGAEHSENPMLPLEVVSEETCTDQCHTPEQSPDFDYPTYYQRVVH